MKIETIQRKIKEGAHVRHDGIKWILWFAGQSVVALNDAEFDTLFDSGAITRNGSDWVAKVNS